jgi:CHAT domain-containing protein/Tfp pilus assembly protein PilF
LYKKTDRFFEAEEHYIKCLEIIEKIYGKEHENYSFGLNNLAGLYEALGQFAKAESYYLESLEIKKNSKGEKSEMYAKSLKTVASFYKTIGNYSKSEECYIKSSEIYKEANGELSSNYAFSLNSLGILYKHTDRYKEAEEHYIKCLEIIEKIYGKEHENYSFGLNNLAGLYEKLGQYSKAENYFLQSLEIIKKSKGESSLEYCNSLLSLAQFYEELGKIQAAEQAYQKCLSLTSSQVGEISLRYSSILHKIGVFYNDNFQFKKSFEALVNSQSILDQFYDHSHPEYLRVLTSLTDLASSIGDAASAEQGLLLVDSLLLKICGGLHPDLIGIEKKIYDLYVSQDSLKQAYLWLIKRDDKLKIRSYNKSELASLFNDYGEYYTKSENYQLANEYYQKAIDLRLEIFGLNHPDYAKSLNDLGRCYLKQQRFDDAIELFDSALIIRQIQFGELNQNVAKSYRNLGNVYKEKKDYQQSYYYLSKAKAICDSMQGSNTTLNVEITKSLIELDTIAKNFSHANELIQSLVLEKQKELINTFSWLKEEEKEIFWKKEAAFFDYVADYYMNTYKFQESISADYFNLTLASKSFLLENKLNENNYYRELIEIKEEMDSRGRLIAKMKSDGIYDKEKLSQLNREYAELENNFIRLNPEYLEKKKNLSITWNQVQQNLVQGEAAIEFVRFYNAHDSIYYYNALILKKGDKNPILVTLCNEMDLQYIKPKLGYSSYYSLVWRPLEVYLNDVQTIYYAPIGELYNIPFHALYAPQKSADELLAVKTNKRGAVIEEEQLLTEPNTSYLIDKHTLHQLTSTRYLAMGLKQKAKEQLPASLAMIGGVNYDYLPGDKTISKATKTTKNQSRSSESFSGKLPYLEGTKIEVEQINDRASLASWQTILMEGNAATEEAIIKLEGKDAIGILHFATHGYAFPAYNFKDTTLKSNSFRYSYRYATNPMVRSGLILAGGNWAWTGSDTLSKLGAEQNGILTALEVSQLNLKKTKLVVLSACETGLGKIEGSEGTFGLKRGFKLAGVEQIIVSLWSVPDKETMELMTLFYTDLAQTLNPVISFEKAQKEMRNRYPTEPDKWAGFVLVR